jgi:hypothetical protein
MESRQTVTAREHSTNDESKASDACYPAKKPPDDAVTCDGKPKIVIVNPKRI